MKYNDELRSGLGKHKNMKTGKKKAPDRKDTIGQPAVTAPGLIADTAARPERTAPRQAEKVMPFPAADRMHWTRYFVTAAVLRLNPAYTLTKTLCTAEWRTMTATAKNG